jgi:hypothetical protein
MRAYELNSLFNGNGVFFFSIKFIEKDRRRSSRDVLGQTLRRFGRRRQKRKEKQQDQKT